MRSQINRRQFLKLLPLLSAPLFKFAWPRVIKEATNSIQNQNAPNILIMVFDTLSAQNVSLYGYDRATTPNLARFAERSVVYHSHYAAANFTVPGTASLLTGTYPWSHRAFNLHGTVNADYVKRNIFSLVPDNYQKTAYTHNFKVASLLYQFRGNLDFWKQTQDLGLNVGNFYNQLLTNDYNVSSWTEDVTLVGGDEPPTSLFLSWIIHRARRMRIVEELGREFGQRFPRGIPNVHTLFFLLEDAIDWIADHVSSISQPFLGYFHLWPPHAPYTARRDFVDIFKDNLNPVAKEPHFFSEGVSFQTLKRRRREYDEYLAYADAEFGRLLDFLEQSGLLDNTYVIFTSDHGELFERGIHGHTTPVLYEPLVRVPLLISKPLQAQREDIHTPTSCVDLLPTLLSVTGQPIPSWCEGVILPSLGGRETNESRPVFAVEAKSNRKNAPLTKVTVAMVNERYKLLQYFGYEGHDDVSEIYDLVNDPDELVDLSSALASSQDLNQKSREILNAANRPYLRNK